MDLSYNQLQGRLPPEIGNCGTQGSGVYFMVEHNKISGPIPDVFGDGNFYIFYASHNQFTGGVPLSLAMVGGVDLSHNHLSARKPFFGALKNSQFLDLSFNQLSGPLPENSGDFSNLKHMDLYNKLSGKVPQSVEWMPNLEYLDLSHNNFTGTVPSKRPSELLVSSS
ncbi:hypothetical protein R1flu_003080 [Riccia fluitans]|uniref:Uncharacterized protein n=1 Tax=Riccia fluitans TaxID=41844 RepID=A0ABD1Y7Z5_9MARC